MFTALFIMDKNCNQHRSPSTGECLNKLGTAIPQNITQQFVPPKKVQTMDGCQGNYAE